MIAGIERHLTHLNLSRALAEKGIKYTSKFYWINYKVHMNELGCAEYSDRDSWTLQDFLPSGGEVEFYGLNLEWYNAYLCSELGEIIVCLKGSVGFPTWDGFTRRWVVLWNGQVHEQDELEVNARAKMIIYLKMNGFATSE